MGGKGDWCLGLTTLPHSFAYLGASTSWSHQGVVQACIGTGVPLPLPSSVRWVEEQVTRAGKCLYSVEVQQTCTVVKLHEPLPPLLLSVHFAFTLKVSFSEVMLETIWIDGCGVRILWKGLCFAKLILMFITYDRSPHMVEATVHKGFVLLIKCTDGPNDHQCGAKMIPSFFWQRVKPPNLSTVQFHPVIYLTHPYQHPPRKREKRKK
jgi:hypothetical protein